MCCERFVAIEFSPATEDEICEDSFVASEFSAEDDRLSSVEILLCSNSSVEIALDSSALILLIVESSSIAVRFAM